MILKLTQRFAARGIMRNGVDANDIAITFDWYADYDPNINDEFIQTFYAILSIGMTEQRLPQSDADALTGDLKNFVDYVDYDVEGIAERENIDVNELLDFIHESLRKFLGEISVGKNVLITRGL